MSTPIAIIWDYDTAIGQVNASFPYNFHEETLLKEIENVENILELGKAYEISMTFAIVGFAAENGQYPYHVPDQIRKIASLGHEIASHSWRHEWFPYLQREQIQRTLRRSKLALEACIGKQGSVRGFVLPFSRPMTWYSKGAVSLGDRVLGPWYSGGSLGSLLPFVAEAGYTWWRVAHRPLWWKLPMLGRFRPTTRAFARRGVWCVPQHCTGFGQRAKELMEKHIAARSPLFVVGHPLGLSLPHEENFVHLQEFLGILAEKRVKGEVEVVTVSECLDGVMRRMTEL